MLGGVTLHMLLHLSGIPHLHVNRPLTSFWYRGPGELGNGLLSVRSGGDTRGTLVLISEYNDKNFNFVSLKVLNFIAHLYRWRHLMNRFMPFLVNCFMSAAQNDSIFKVEKKVLFNKEEKWWRWPQELNFWNYGIGWHIQKEHGEKCALAKNQVVGANWCGVISNVMLRGLHPDLFK